MDKMNKLKKGVGLVLAFLILYGCYKIIMFIFQEKCSNYPCPDGYVKNESKKDKECNSLTCDSVDRDTCCNKKQKCSKYSCPSGYEGKDNSDNILCKDSVCKESDDRDTCCNKSIDCEGSWSDFGACSLECGGGTQTRTYNITTQPQYGGTPCPDTPESQSCNTEACVVDVVANATCSTVSGNCPVGYLYKTDSSNIACNGPTCNVEIGGVDLDTCCEQGCSAPGSMPTGYTGSLPDSLPVGVGDISEYVQCDENYHGDPTYNCTNAGTQYTIIGGCDPDVCNTPPDTTGYNITSVTSLERNNFPVNVTCEDGYGPSNEGDIPRASCSGDSEPYNLSGCNDKTGFCSGNTDSSNDVLCPTGYNDKSDKNTIVGDTPDICCDQIITSEEEPSGTQDTELPICADVMEPNKVPPDQGFSGEVGNLQACSDFCSLLPSCRSFAYSEIDSTQVPSGNSEIRNCFIGTSTDSVPPSGILTQPWYSFSFYPKCRME